MKTTLELALDAQQKLAEKRAEYAGNPRENSAALDARDRILTRLETARDEAARTAGVTAVQLDAMLYG